MKLKCIITIVLLGLFCINAKAQSKIKYNYPENIADSAKKLFVKSFNQGYILYKVSCSKCHNKISKGKEIIPDFSLPQLMDYEIRIFPEHNGKLMENRLTNEELEKIILFLRYKKVKK
jgi:hypothetical protein